jgi:sigma-B regulation protein RsbU (phosphoserine phosphatase)
MKILIAEDDPVASKILRLTLEHVGHEVIVVSDGAAAWQRFLDEPIRIVISDWMMPEVDGLQLCRRIRERSDIEYTYFILLTANHARRENMAVAMEAGIDDFVTKPLDRDTIKMRLRVAERILGYTRQICQLGALLPICAFCKKIREDGAYWQQFEAYIQEHTGSHFSHGVCPECFEQQVRELDEKKTRPVLSVAAPPE